MIKDIATFLKKRKYNKIYFIELDLNFVYLNRRMDEYSSQDRIFPKSIDVRN